MDSWVIDAYIRGDRVLLAVLDERGGALREREVEVLFYGYLSSKDPDRVAEELSGVDGVVDARVEEWRTPPFYESASRVVVFRTRSYGALRRVLRVSARRGLRPLNTFPHPLVEALFRAGIRPLTRVRREGGGTVETKEWDPTGGDPPLRYLVLGLESGLFVARTRSEARLFTTLEDLAEYVRSQEFHVGFADPYVYAALLEAEPGLSRRVRWVTGGAFSPHEYFEWSRLSYTPLSLMSNVTIGRVLTTIEALHARARRMVVDRSVGRRERWRSMSELLLNDRGGVTYQPGPGFYWWVCQVDFRSLYPSIMVRYNVSGETVDRPRCTNRLLLPWTPHDVCLDEEGVVPSTLRGLIELKDLYERLYGETGDAVYHERKSAVKWILVASFGYLGYRNSLFGSVMAHEVVTSTGREALLRARLAVEGKGYRVVHAIVDSVFIGGVRTLDECDLLRRVIEETTGFRAKVEAHYAWLYVPRSRVRKEGVANRYYGLLSDGSGKVKGVLAVRRDTPLLVKRAQLEALERLFGARSPEELAARIPEAHAVIEGYARAVERGDVDPYELVVTRRSRAREGYMRPPEYVLKGRPPYRLAYARGRLVPLEDALRTGLDAGKYVELLERARGELPRLEDLRGEARPPTSLLRAVRTG